MLRLGGGVAVLPLSVVPVLVLVGARRGSCECWRCRVL